MIIILKKRARWIARIPRKDWHPTEKSNLHICERHFLPSHIISESIDKNNRRKRKRGNNELAHKHLTDDAVPCIWPNTPAYLSKESTPRPTSLGPSEARQENAQRIRLEIE